MKRLLQFSYACKKTITILFLTDNIPEVDLMYAKYEDTNVLVWSAKLSINHKLNKYMEKYKLLIHGNFHAR